MGYSFSPGLRGLPSAVWPAQTKLARNASGYTLVLGLHPECECSEATLEELGKIVARTGAALRVSSLFVELPGFPESADASALWKKAERIAGVSVLRDPKGVEARRFDARTSGEAFLYGPDGRLLFHGGLTASRGHAGGNPGEAAVIAFVTQGPGARAPSSTPVFGCGLFNP